MQAVRQRNFTGQVNNMGQQKNVHIFIGLSSQKVGKGINAGSIVPLRFVVPRFEYDLLANFLVDKRGYDPALRLRAFDLDQDFVCKVGAKFLPNFPISSLPYFFLPSSLSEYLLQFTVSLFPLFLPSFFPLHMSLYLLSILSSFLSSFIFDSFSQMRSISMDQLIPLPLLTDSITIHIQYVTSSGSYAMHLQIHKTSEQFVHPINKLAAFATGFALMTLCNGLAAGCSESTFVKIPFYV